jgi:hypothetical protein
MRIRALFSAIAPLAVALAIGVVASKAADDPVKGQTSQPESKPPAAQPAAGATSAVQTPLSVGERDSARWTATTYEAAATEANKKVLASGKPMTISGEVVDVSCYLQLGKRGEAHVACGSKCIANGQPIGLLDGKQNLYILFPEEHHPRRDGQVDLRTTFLPLLAKNVTVSGMMTEMRGYRALFVRALTVGSGAASGDEDKKDVDGDDED